MRVDVAGLLGQQPHRGVGHFRPAVARLPHGAARLAARSRAIDGHRLGTTGGPVPVPRAPAGRGAFDASYSGIPVAARRLAAELMNTIAEPGSSTCSAAPATRKCALVLTANISSHWAAVVPAILARAR